jgi:hypothetical protein
MREGRTYVTHNEEEDTLTRGLGELETRPIER